MKKILKILFMSIFLLSTIYIAPAKLHPALASRTPSFTSEQQMDDYLIQAYGKDTNKLGFKANWVIYEAYHLIVYGYPSDAPPNSPAQDYKPSYSKTYPIAGYSDSTGYSPNPSSVPRYLGQTRVDGSAYENPYFPPDVPPSSSSTNPEIWYWHTISGASNTWLGLTPSQKITLSQTSLIGNNAPSSFTLASKFGSSYQNYAKVQGPPTWKSDGSVWMANYGTTQGVKTGNYYATFATNPINANGGVKGTLTQNPTSYTMGPLDQSVTVNATITADPIIGGQAVVSDIESMSATFGNGTKTIYPHKDNLTTVHISIPGALTLSRSDYTPGTHTVPIQGTVTLKTIYGDSYTQTVKSSVTLTVQPSSGPPAIHTTASVSPSSVQFQNADIPVTVNVSGLVSNVKDPNSIDHYDIYARFSNSTSYQKITVSGGMFSPSASFTFTIPAPSITVSPQPVPFTATVRAFFKAGAGLPNYIDDSSQASTLVYQGSPPAPPPTATPTNPTDLPPTANINSPASVEAGQDFYINANGSNDPDGTIQSYNWSLPGSSGSVSGTGGSIWYSWPGYVTSHTEGLTVTDDSGSSGSTSQSITVTAPQPKAIIKFAGTAKQNRTITLDGTGSTSPNHYPMDATQTVWQLSPQSGCTTSDIDFSGSLTGVPTKAILVKQPCTVQVTLTVTNTAGLSDSSSRTLTVAPDMPPVVQMDAPVKVTRDPSNGNQSTFVLTDNSYSPDRDILATQDYHIAYDSNNDGSPAGELYEDVKLSGFSLNQTTSFTLSGNPYTITKIAGNQLKVTSQEVGKTFITESITEAFGQPTLSSFIASSDYQTATGQITVDTINTPPISSFMMAQPKKVDLVVNTGNTSYNSSTVQSAVNNDLLPKLRADNIDATVTYKNSYQDAPSNHQYLYTEESQSTTKNYLYLHDFSTGLTTNLGEGSSAYMTGTKLVYPHVQSEYYNGSRTYYDEWYIHDFLANTDTDTGLRNGNYHVLIDGSPFIGTEGTLYFIEPFNYSSGSYEYQQYWLDKWDMTTRSYTRINELYHFSYYTGAGGYNNHEFSAYYDYRTNIAYFEEGTTNGLGLYKDDMDTNTGPTYLLTLPSTQYGPGSFKFLNDGNIVYNAHTYYNDGRFYLYSPSTKTSTDITPGTSSDNVGNVVVDEKDNIVLMKLTSSNTIYAYDDTLESVNPLSAFNDGNNYNLEYTTPEGTVYWMYTDSSGNPVYGKYDPLTQVKKTLSSIPPGPVDMNVNVSPQENIGGSIIVPIHQTIQQVSSSLRTGSSKYYIDVEDNKMPELSQDRGLNQDIQSLNNGIFQYIGLGTSSSQSQLTAFMGDVSAGGQYYDDTNLDNALNQLATNIISSEDTQSTVTDTLTMQRNADGTYQPVDVNYQLFYSDYENDPIADQHWLTNQDPTSYENSMGMIARAGQYTDTAIHQFDKTGKFTIYHQYQDDPKNDSRFTNYWLWSNPNYSNTVIYVNRQPASDFTASASLHATTGSYDVTVNDQSFDPDHQSQANRGITQKIWQYKTVGAASWTSGQPSSIPAGSTYLISLKVKDLDGSWSKTTVHMVEGTTTNLPPIADFTINPQTISLSGSYTIADNTTDPNGDAIATEAWTATKEGVQIYSYTGVPNLGPPNAAALRSDASAKGVSQQGTYTMTLKASDGQAWNESYSDSVTMQNFAPIPNFSMPSSVYRSTSFTLNNSTTDPDGDTVSYQWTVIHGSYSNTFSTASKPTFHFNSLGLGTAAVSKDWMIRLTATDSNGANASITEPIQVVDQKPVASASGPSNGYVNIPYSFSSSDSDPDPADTLTYTWKVVSPSGVETDYTTASLSLTFDEKGNWSIEHYVDDGLGEQSNTVVLTLDILNQLPIAGFTVSPTTIHRGQQITVTSTATDLDGYVNSYDYYVTPPGQSEYLYSPSRDWTWTGMNIIGTWAIRQQITDNDGGVDASDAVQQVHVVDRPPSVTLTTPSGPDISHPSGNEPPFTATWTYRDPDNDPQSTYDAKIVNASTGVPVWDSGVQHGSAASMQISGALTGATTYEMTLTVSDGEGMEATSDPKYFITNQPPNADFTWTPQPVWEGDTVTLQDASTDPDSDPLSRQWHILQPDGTIGSGSSRTPQLAQVSAGRYAITLKVSDGWSRASVTKTIQVGRLTIDAEVHHTANWLAIHQKKHHQTTTDPKDFYSGEQIIVTCHTAAAPVQRVQAELNTLGIDGHTIQVLTGLKRSSANHYTGTLYKAAMMDPSTRMDDGIVQVQVQVTYTNGTVKKQNVPIRIIGSAYEIVGVHRIQ